jgi:DNA-binding PadR family transcriptional regulator
MLYIFLILSRDRGGGVARVNKTKYAVLGLLAWQPMSGYDIHKVYRATLAGSWSESYGQIYPILKQLVAEGLAVRTGQDGDTREGGRPARSVYSITEEGRGALKGWLGDPMAPYKPKVELMLKMLHGFQAPAGVMLAQVQQFRAEQEAALATLAETERGISARAGGPFDHAVPYWLLAARLGRLVGEAMVRWCDEAVPVLESLDDEPPGGPVQRRHDHKEPR